MSSQEALRISREQFVELGLREKLDFPQRKAVGGGHAHHIVLKEPTPKTEADRCSAVDSSRRGLIG